MALTPLQLINQVRTVTVEGKPPVVNIALCAGAGVDLTALSDGSVGAPSIAYEAAVTTGIYRDSDGRVSIANDGEAVFHMGAKDLTNLQGVPLRAYTEWKHPPYDASVENTAAYIKLTHRDDELNDFIYGIYAEIENQSLTGGSFSKIMHFGRGDAHYVALFADPALNGGLSGGFGYEAAMFADAESGFLGSFQGTSGFVGSNPAQQNCIPFQALVHDDATDPTLQGMDFTNFGLFYAVNSLSNAFVVRQSEYTPNLGIPQFKLADHNLRPIWIVHGSGEVHQYGLEADAANPNRNAPEHRFRSYYWDNTAEQSYDVVFSPSISGAPTPTPQFSIAFQEIVNGTPQAAETVLVINPNVVNFQDIPLAGVGGITMESGQSLDMQAGPIEDAGSLTMQAGGGNLDLNGGTALDVGGLTMAAGGGTLDLQTGQGINIGAMSPAASSSMGLGSHYSAGVTLIGVTANAATIDFYNGNQHFLDMTAATGTVTLTLNNLTQGGTYKIKVFNNPSSHMIQWPAGYFFSNGAQPTSNVNYFTIEWDGSNAFVDRKEYT